MNNAKAPLDSVAVRKALGYAIDRDAIVARLFGGLGVKGAVNSLNPPILSKLADQSAWSNYKLDLNQVTTLMTGDGWAKGADGIWAKGGQRATIEFKTTAGNKRRELTQQIVQQQAKEAGFELTINNQKSGDLFGKQLPAGDFQLALYAQVLTNLEPANCGLFCSKNIPTAANDNTRVVFTASITIGFWSTYVTCRSVSVENEISPDQNGDTATNASASSGRIAETPMYTKITVKAMAVCAALPGSLAVLATPLPTNRS